MSDSASSAPPPGANPLWETTGSGNTAALPGASGELEPLSRRLLRVVGLLSVLLILVVVNSLLNSSENPFNPVASAAARAEKCPGFRFRAYFLFSSPALPEPIAGSGSGAFNSETKRTRTAMSVNSSITGPGRFFEISDGHYSYQSGSNVEDELPPGKTWVRTDKNEKKSDDFSLDFDEAMQMLSKSGGVQLVGREAIDGRMTRRYRADIELGELIDLLRSEGKDEAAAAYETLQGVSSTGISAEVWVDGKKLPRQMRMVIPMPGKKGKPPMTIDMRMQLFDFGAHPKIQLPNPKTVVDGPLDSPARGQIS